MPEAEKGMEKKVSTRRPSSGHSRGAQRGKKGAQIEKSTRTGSSLGKRDNVTETQGEKPKSNKEQGEALGKTEKNNIFLPQGLPRTLSRQQLKTTGDRKLGGSKKMRGDDQPCWERREKKNRKWERLTTSIKRRMTRIKEEGRVEEEF